MGKKIAFLIAASIFIFVFVGSLVTVFAKGDDSNEDRSGSSGNGSRDEDEKSEDKIEEKKEDERKEDIRVESRGGQTRIELRQKNDGDKTRIKQEIRTQNGRIKFETKDGKTRVKVETKTGQPQGEFTVENPLTSSQLAEIENPEGEFKLKIRTRGDRFELRAKGASTLTNFPLSFNPETNEVSITTPQGTVLIKTLPQVAVQNVLASNIMDRVAGQNVSEEDEEDIDEEDVEDEEIEEVETPEVRVEGFVGSLTDSQIIVSEVTFAINNTTKLEGAIAVGSGVKVKGIPQNGIIVARKVELEDKVEPKVKIEGVVESVTNDTIVVSGIKFARSPATRIEGNLALGQRIEIKGTPVAGGTLLANKVEIEIPGEGMVLAQEQGVTVFKVKGQKDSRFLNLIPVTFPIEATVSVSTGEILSVSRPLLLQVLGFLFRT